MEPLACAMSIIVGVMNCFFGYKIFRIVLGIWGFLGGALLVGGLAHRLFQNEVAAIAGGFLGGLVGATACVLLFHVGVFVLGGALGAVVGIMLSAMAGAEPHLGLLLLLGLVGGVAALLLRRPVIILSTAFAGSFTIVIGSIYFLGGYAPKELLQDPQVVGRLANAAFFGWLVLGAVGTVLQLVTTGKKLSPQK